MPAMTNAERQRLHRERKSLQLAGSDTEASRLFGEVQRLKTALATLRKHDVNLQALTDKQIVDRAEMIDDLLSDRPWWRRSKKAVKFMGMSRDDWASMASSHPELVAHFGLAAAVERAHAKMQYDLFHNMERRGRRL